jgi:hypothetical protein
LQGDLTSRFSRLFTGRTIRIDTTHGGHRGAEWVRVDDVSREGTWSAGRPSSTSTELGDYRCRLRGIETGDVLFTCGYSSFFDEWRSTNAARPGEERSFSESLRIPEPQTNTGLTIEGRTGNGTFRTLLDTVLSPDKVRDAVPHPAAEIIDVSVRGNPAICVNLLFVAEGYVERERNKFLSDVERISDLLFQIEPYKSTRSAFSMRGLFAASKESGISDPTQGRHVETFLGASFDVFGIARYMLTFENQRLRQAASHTAYDCLIVLCNCDTYGGGGVFNQYACVAADALHSQYLIAHELGHSFAGLADEYYTSLVTYDTGQGLSCEPWHRNVTLERDRATLKWGHLVDLDVPLPTPWEQQRYDELAAQVRTSTDSNEETSPRGRNLAEQMTVLLEGNRYYGRVGAFQGALYRPAGAYRPEVDCLMFSRSHTRFCRVCCQAIEERIAELTQPTV